MEINTKIETPIDGNEPDYFGRLWDESWIYIKTIVDVVREPVLILDKKLCVMAANGSFYRSFQVEKDETKGKKVYDLGNGQWDIPALRTLLEEILPHNTFFNGFEVTHIFPTIGRKVMMLSARQIHYQKDPKSDRIPPIIMLAFEDVTEMMSVADSLTDQMKLFQTSVHERTTKLESQVALLENEIKKMKG